MKEDTSEVNCRDNKADSAIETITRAQQLKIEAHYKAEARRGWQAWEERKAFLCSFKDTGPYILKMCSARIFVILMDEYQLR